MSLSLSFKPLPTLHACYSVPIQWSVAGNTSAVASQGQIKLVFVSAQSSAVVVVSQSTGSTTSRRLVVTSSTTARPSITSLTTSSVPGPTSTPTTTTTTRIARRAASTPFTKTVTTVPITYTSVGWPTIALPSGTYNLAAYLVPSANAAEALVGVQRGVQVVQGTETGCLVAAGSSSATSSPSSSSSSASSSSNGVNSTIASPGAPTNGQAVTDDPTAKEPTPKGPLIGGIIGAILGILLLVGLAYVFIRRRRRRHLGRHGAFPRSWFRNRDDVARDRGVGSAFGHDFGALGSGVARRVEQDEKEAEKTSVGKAGEEAYGMVSVLPRRNTDLLTGSAYPTPFQESFHPLEVSTMEYLASAAAPPPPPPPQVGHTSPSDASHEYPTSHLSHGRNNSETSHTTGQSHIALLGPSGSGSGNGGATFPSYDPLNDTSIVPGGTAPASASDHPTGSFNRRTSGTPSTYSSQQRRKSSIAGAAAAGVGVERSGSVRRKPVPAVEALEDGGPSSVTAAAAAAGGGNDKQKSFVLDVEPRSLER